MRPSRPGRGDRGRAAARRRSRTSAGLGRAERARGIRIEPSRGHGAVGRRRARRAACSAASRAGAARSCSSRTATTRRALPPSGRRRRGAQGGRHRLRDRDRGPAVRARAAPRARRGDRRAATSARARAASCAARTRRSRRHSGAPGSSSTPPRSAPASTPSWRSPPTGASLRRRSPSAARPRRDRRRPAVPRRSSRPGCGTLALALGVGVIVLLAVGCVFAAPRRRPAPARGSSRTSARRAKRRATGEGAARPARGAVPRHGETSSRRTAPVAEAPADARAGRRAAAHGRVRLRDRRRRAVGLLVVAARSARVPGAPRPARRRRACRSPGST